MNTTDNAYVFSVLYDNSTNNGQFLRAYIYLSGDEQNSTIAGDLFVQVSKALGNSVLTNNNNANYTDPQTVNATTYDALSCQNYTATGATQYAYVQVSYTGSSTVDVNVQIDYADSCNTDGLGSGSNGWIWAIVIVAIVLLVIVVIVVAGAAGFFIYKKKQQQNYSLYNDS